MIRESATRVDTPFGTFGVDIFESETANSAGESLGPTFYAETEDGTFVVNGVEYRGTVYFKRYRPGGELFLDGQHAYRWVNDRMQTISDSARRKLDEALRPTVDDIANDTDRVTARRIRALKSDVYYALQSANREIDKANEAARKARELGADDVQDVARFEVSHPDY